MLRSKFQIFKIFPRILTRNLSLSNGGNSHAEKRDDYTGGNSLMELTDITKNSSDDGSSLARAFDSLFGMYKREDPNQIQNILSSKEFSECCRALRRNSPKMTMNEILTCIKALNRLQVKSNSRMMQQLLHLLKDNINNLTISHLAFFHLLLKQMESTPLVEALIIAIPVVFNFNIADQIDHENPDELHKIFHHVTITKMKVGMKGLLNIISALTIHGDSLSFNTATSCLISLTRLPPKVLQEQPSQKLLQNCLQIINSDKVIFTDFTSIYNLLYKMVMKYKDYHFLDQFYNPKFFNKLIDFVIQDDLGFDKAFNLVSVLGEINYVNYELLDYIDKQIIQNESILKHMELGKLKTLTSALSVANYKTKNWEVLKSVLHDNPIFGQEIPVYMPVLRTAAELMSLDFVSRIFLENIFDEEFLKEHLKFFSKNNNFQPMGHLRLLSQAIKILYPEHEDILPPKIFLDIANDKIPEAVDEYHQDMLEFIYGSNSVMTNIKTAYGHRLDFVINFDGAGKPVEVSNKIKFYEELPLHKVQPIAVLFQLSRNCPINYPLKFKGVNELRRRSLQKIGIKEIVIPSFTLDNLPDAEKCAFIEREISEGGIIFDST